MSALARRWRLEPNQHAIANELAISNGSQYGISRIVEVVDRTSYLLVRYETHFDVTRRVYEMGVVYRRSAFHRRRATWLRVNL